MWQIVLGLIAAVAVVLAAVLWLPMLQPAAPDPSDGAGRLPWQVQVRPDGGLRVLGLTVGGPQADSLDGAQALWPQEVMKIAVLANRDAAPALEAFLDAVRVGGLQGKLVLTARVDAATLAAWSERATQRDTLPSGAHRLTLAAADLDAARRSPLAGAVFLPAARLDEATLLQRFGPGAQRLTTPDGAVHLLYPGIGTAITLDSSGDARPVVQYAPPAEFEARLHAPLRQSAASEPAPAAASMPAH